MCLRTHTGLQHQVIHSPSAMGFWAAASSGRAQGRCSHREAQQCLILCVDPDIRMFTVCIRLLPFLKSSAIPNQLTTCQLSDGYIKLCLLAFLYCLGSFDLVALTNHTNCLDSTSRHSLHESRGFQGNVRPLLEKTVGSCLGAEYNVALQFTIILFLLLLLLNRSTLELLKLSAQSQTLARCCCSQSNPRTAELPDAASEGIQTLIPWARETQEMLLTKNKILKS